MQKWFLSSNNLEENTKALRKDIQYHSKALDCCTPDFKYYRDIKTSLAESYAQLAHVYYRAKEYLTALNFYQKTIEHNHHHFQARNQIGQIYFKQNKFKEAIETFENIILLASEPYDVNHKLDSLLSLGLIYANLNTKGSINRAYKYIIDAKMISPDYELTSEILQKITEIENYRFSSFQKLATDSICSDTQSSESQSTLIHNGSNTRSTKNVGSEGEFQKISIQSNMLINNLINNIENEEESMDYSPVMSG